MRPSWCSRIASDREHGCEFYYLSVLLLLYFTYSLAKAKRSVESHRATPCLEFGRQVARLDSRFFLTTVHSGCGFDS